MATGAEFVEAQIIDQDHDQVGTQSHGSSLTLSDQALALPALSLWCRPRVGVEEATQFLEEGIALQSLLLDHRPHALVEGRALSARERGGSERNDGDLAIPRVLPQLLNDGKRIHACHEQIQ